MNGAVVGKRDAGTDEEERRLALDNEFDNNNLDPSNESDRGIYQCLLFLLTQLGYLAVAPSMLSTTFFEPSPEFCAEFTRSNKNLTLDHSLSLFNYIGATSEFHSLLMEWREHCSHSSWTFWASTAIMIGAIAGSFIAGFVADRFGRKPTVVGSMLLISLANALLVFTGAFDQFLALSLFFAIGLACGGYMVTNMVLLIEILNHSTTRLLVVSLNGWPFGMVGTALLAYHSLHWRFYHLSISLLALFFFIIIHFFVFESIPWLVQSGRSRRAHLAKQGLLKINSALIKNNRRRPSTLEVNKDSVALNSSKQITASSLPSSLDHNQDESGSRNYTYLDLFRHRSICLRLITLLFCFGSSSIVSFGLYFSAEVLPGSRYVNIAMMGVGKLALGLLPFILSNVMGRRPIMLISIGLASVACWCLIAGWLIFDLSKHWLIAALGLFITGVIDPNWKIIHLLSMELFPTPVRNMARALCNVVARLGSLSGPLVLLLRAHNELLPFLLFAALLSVQWLISLCFLPETQGQPLPEQMPTDNRYAPDNDMNEEADDFNDAADSKRSTRHRSVSSQRSHHSVCSRAYSVDVPIV